MAHPDYCICLGHNRCEWCKEQEKNKKSSRNLRTKVYITSMNAIMRRSSVVSIVRSMIIGLMGVYA